MFALVPLLKRLAEWDLSDPSWRYDAIPEIVGGRNVMDYIGVDEDIMRKLEELEVGKTKPKTREE